MNYNVLSLTWNIQEAAGNKSLENTTRTGLNTYTGTQKKKVTSELKRVVESVAKWGVHIFCEEGS